MKVAVISIGRSGSSELIRILNTKGIDIVPKPYNHLYPENLLKKYGKSVKVIFITRKITEVINSLINKDKEWIKVHYTNLNSDFNDYPNIFNKDTLNFEKLFDAYYNNTIFQTLFIKYENLYFQDISTLQAINTFLNTNFILDDFKYNRSNGWNSLNTLRLTDSDAAIIQNTFQSLEDKIYSYVFKYVISPNYLINKIVMLKENSHDGRKHYRLGDIIRQDGHYWKESIEFILNQDLYKDSILRRYLECCPHNNLKEKNKNYLPVLTNIINDKIKEGFELPRDDELVIHLRLGDTVEFKWFLQKDYCKIIKEYIDKFNIKKVTFCTAFHYGNNLEYNKWIYTHEKHQLNILKLTEVFTKVIELFNIIIDVKSSIDVDKDIIYMVKAKYLLEDHGGFSKLIKDLYSYTNKCNRTECNYKKHERKSNNGGTHCCLACKDKNQHGPNCKKIVYEF
jgi:hypothetical protein